MSFGINGPDNLPAIQKSHHTNDGGAGNLGYFQQNKKKKEEEKDENDVLELSTSKNSDGDDMLIEELDSIGTRIKNFWLVLKHLGKKEKKAEE